MSDLKDFVIEDGVLKKYVGQGGVVVIPNGVTHIDNGAFEFCDWLTSVTIPESVKSIGDAAFLGCRYLTTIEIPESVTEFGEGIFSDCLSLKEITCNSRIAKLNKQNTGSLFYVIIKFPNLTLATKEKLSALAAPMATIKNGEEYAYVWCFQSGKSWEELLNKAIVDVNEVVQAFGKIVSTENKVSDSLYKKMLAYIEINAHLINKESLVAFLEILGNKDKKGKMSFLNSSVIKSIIENESATRKHPIEELVERNFVASIEYTTAFKEIKTGIHYIGSDQTCDAKVLAFIVSEYMKKIGEVKYISEYKTACWSCEFAPIADEVVAALDKSELQDMLMNLAFEKGGSFIMPFARYADEKHAAILISQMKKWADWGSYAATGRKNIIIARCGLLLSDTKAAMLHMDSVGKLDVYAKMRGTEVDVIRDTILSDFGFDEKGKIYYDLKETIVSANISQDLKVYLIDENTGKEVKSLPKKNIENDVYERVKEQLSNLKKNLKKVFANRKDKVVECFLSGKTQESKIWEKIYLKNPVFMGFASLVVWSQNKKSFILNDNGAVDSDGKEYLITDKPISVAHPIEMSEQEIVAWQKYFSSNGLKQPFDQIWEPVYKSENIFTDRYKECVISAYKLQNKEKHGIFTFGMYDYSERYGFKLMDCMMNYSQVQERFMFGKEVELILGEFSFNKLTRYVNHIIFFFDKLTIFDKITKDDISIAVLLDSFTIAQILEFIDFASKNNSVNVLSLLLNYKNERFGDFNGTLILEL